MMINLSKSKYLYQLRDDDELDDNDTGATIILGPFYFENSLTEKNLKNKRMNIPNNVSRIRTQIAIYRDYSHIPVYPFYLNILN